MIRLKENSQKTDRKGTGIMKENRYELRKTLYWSTRNILSFKYVDVDITALSISGPYLGMLEDYFRKSEE